MTGARAPRNRALAAASAPRTLGSRPKLTIASSNCRISSSLPSNAGPSTDAWSKMASSSGALNDGSWRMCSAMALATVVRICARSSGKSDGDIGMLDPSSGERCRLSAADGARPSGTPSASSQSGPGVCCSAGGSGEISMMPLRSRAPICAVLPRARRNLPVPCDGIESSCSAEGVPIQGELPQSELRS